jgi:hypothetical protein
MALGAADSINLQAPAEDLFAPLPALARLSLDSLPLFVFLVIFELGWRSPIDDATMSPSTNCVEG